MNLSNLISLINQEKLLEFKYKNPNFFPGLFLYTSIFILLTIVLMMN